LLNGLASIPDIKKEIKDSTDDLVNKFGLEYLQRELVKSHLPVRLRTMTRIE
jgi:hypothetical protein